ncbi:hypothetical protein PR202_ga13356 [Eleusine coracana subsp. coracana]|uniref:Reverse transcriptase zinc-binding domain-containing protein n=1 Tax=Eleusine coracana subsp. coracana TaxID=191504 RepID=A0AAV5CEH9_ELECO|nr:hypothetical protein PR202_ga13356 [Eleusine coracana subsp. coracana]
MSMHFHFPVSCPVKYFDYYRLLVGGASTCDFADFVWRNRSPPCAQFFMWLLVQESVKNRALLLTKHIVPDTACELCSTNYEDANHIIFHCVTAAAFWSVLGIDVGATPSVRCLWDLPRPPCIPAAHFISFIHLCCWHIWKHRNELITIFFCMRLVNEGLLILGAVVEPTEAVCTVACVKGAYIRCRNYPRQQLYGCACHCAPPDGKRCVVHLPDRKAQRCWKRG